MWFIPLLIGLALTVVAYLIMPKPKREQPAATKDMDDPVVEAGAPVPVIFGTLTVKGLNILWYGDKNKADYQIQS